IRQGVASPAALAAELLDRSGLHDLRAVLDTRFVGRRDVLKARSALLAVLSVIADAPPRDGGALAAEVERIFADAHEFAELRLLGALHRSSVKLPGDLTAGAETRLGMPSDATLPALRDAALQALDRWQRRAENPMLSRPAADACRTVVRTCE